MEALSKFAACYIRVSTDEQSEFSPEAQLTAIRDYAKKNGYILLDRYVFKDEGISGRKAEKRPAFMRMIAAAKEKPCPFEVILVHKIDRFARSREDSVVYKSLLRKECKVKVVSITENIEDDKFSVILEAMLEAMAEYYSLNLSDEVKKGMTEKAKRGGLQSAPGFGYTVENNVLVPLPYEAEIIRSIFERFISGEGYFAIARWLNSLGVKTHRGNKFENRTIEYIIRNPVYIGKLRWNPVEKTRRNYDSENIIVADAEHEPLVDMNTWETAQKRVLEIKAQWRKHMRPAAEHKDWLSGLVKCSECGSSLIKAGSHYWKCGAYAKGKCSYSQHTSDEKLKDMISDCLKKESRAKYKLDYQIVSKSSASQSERALLIAQIEKADMKLERVREAYYSGTDSLDEYKNIKAVIESEKAVMQKRLDQVEIEDHRVDYSSIVKEKLKNMFEILHSSDVSSEEKHRAAHDSIKEVVYNKSANSLEIVYFASIIP